MNTILQCLRAGAALAWAGVCLYAADTPAAGAAPGWPGLKAGQSPVEVNAALNGKEGAPLIVSKSKDGRFETWNYDCGGYVMFVHGQLDFWVAPRPVSTRGPVKVRHATPVRGENSLAG